MNNTNLNIEQESQEYIDWTLDKLRDPQYFENIVTKVKERFLDYCMQTDRTQLLHDLKVKMTAGAKEHVALPATNEAIQKEVEEEYLDIIAYDMMPLFFFEKQRKALGIEPPPVPPDSNDRTEKEQGIRIISVPSETVEGKFYIVKVDTITNFPFECSCPAFMFRNSQKVPCKHMRKLNEGSSPTRGFQNR